MSANDGGPATSDLAGLPRELLDRLTHPFADFLRIEALGGVVLLAAAFVVMPLFALANAALPFSLNNLEMSAATTIFIALVIGKPLGILTFCWLAVRAGVATRPAELSWRVMAGGSALAGIGFTMSLFIAGRAFEPGLIDSAKLGIFAASIVSAALGLAVLSWAARADAPTRA